MKIGYMVGFEATAISHRIEMTYNTSTDNFASAVAAAWEESPTAVVHRTGMTFLTDILHHGPLGSEFTTLDTHRLGTVVLGFRHSRINVNCAGRVTEARHIN